MYPCFIIIFYNPDLTSVPLMYPVYFLHVYLTYIICTKKISGEIVKKVGGGRGVGKGGLIVWSKLSGTVYTIKYCKEKK